MSLSRRGFFTGMVALVASPAIVRAASLMPVRAPQLVVRPGGLVTIDQITREAIRQLRNSNAFLKNLDSQYDGTFAKLDFRIGTKVQISLPQGYRT